MYHVKPVKDRGSKEPEIIDSIEDADFFIVVRDLEDDHRFFDEEKERVASFYSYDTDYEDAKEYAEFKNSQS